MKLVDLSRADGARGSMGSEEVLEILGGSTIETVMGQQGDLVLNLEFYRKPVEVFQDGCDMVEFSHSHQDPSSAVLDVLQPLDVLARDPDEKCITVV